MKEVFIYFNSVVPKLCDQIVKWIKLKSIFAYLCVASYYFYSFEKKLC